MIATMQKRGRTLFPKTLQICTHIVLRMEKGEKTRLMSMGSKPNYFDVVLLCFVVDVVVVVKVAVDIVVVVNFVVAVYM